MNSTTNNLKNSTSWTRREGRDRRSVWGYAGIHLACDLKSQSKIEELFHYEEAWEELMVWCPGVIIKVFKKDDDDAKVLVRGINSNVKTKRWVDRPVEMDALESRKNLRMMPGGNIEAFKISKLIYSGSSSLKAIVKTSKMTWQPHNIGNTWNLSESLVKT